MNLQREVTAALHGFVAEVVGITQRAGVTTLQSAMHAELRSRQPSPQSAPGARSPKRTGEQLKVLCDRLVAFIEQNPGLRVEQINAALGTRTRELALPIRKLLSDGVLQSQGRVRATTYTRARCER